MIEELILMPEKDRASFLEHHATIITEGQYFRKFDDENLLQSRTEYTDKCIELIRLQDEYEAIKTEFKAKIKVIEQAKKELMIGIMQSGE